MEQSHKTIALHANNLRKSFFHPIAVDVLKEINLTVHHGEAIAITGRSGQGKSTLLQLLGTLEDPCGGILEIAGKKVASNNKSAIRNRHLAFIFQSFHLLEDYTALDNVLMPARIARKKVSKHSQAYQHGMHLLERVGLSDRAHFNSKLLSGGEKQRVAIARALCNDPDIILADEPSGNLDKQTASNIHHLLLEFARQENKSVVIVTHDPDLASLCDQQYVLQDGLLHKQENFH
ncbi:MAG: ABC transporter ATP-binding protein [Parachlamydiaceae bacterium]|nr:ABC transporter ATP-binding protein [Parachlamydiaceae bacterium]